MKLHFKNEEEIDKILDKAVKDLEKAAYGPAFARLKPYWPFPVEELDKLERETVQRMPYASQRFGATIGSCHVKTRKIGDYVQRRYYAIRHEYHVIRLVFTFYRNDKGWALNGFTWDDVLDELWNE